MKISYLKAMVAAVLSSFMSVSAQSFSEYDVVYLYDSTTQGYNGLDEDYLYININEALPEEYLLVPVEMSTIDEEGLSALAQCKLIVVSDTGNDRDVDDPVVKRLGELVDISPMLCLNADFAERFTFLKENDETLQFQIVREIADPLIYISKSEQQEALFDDVLSAPDGTTALYLPGVHAWINAANNVSNVIPGYFYTFAHVVMPDTSSNNPGIMCSNPSGNFFFLGLAQPLMDRLSPAGKNLVRNVVRYMLDKQFYSTRPHLSSIKVNGTPVSADFMAELSSGQAHLDVVYDTYKYISLEIETICHDSNYTSSWHADYSEQQACIEYWYDDLYDIYIINYDFVETGGTSIDTISNDNSKSRSIEFDLLGRHTQQSHGLVIEDGCIFFQK